MEIEKIDQIIESILFVSGDSIDIKELMDKLELQQSEIKQSVKRLQEKYCGVSGIHIIYFNDKIQFTSNPDYADIISAVLNPIKEKELSRAALEVVAIIAYKQPITRLEIEQVRGVNSDYAVQMLLKHNLIQAVGRKDAIGKPLLFGTTDGFLKRFGLNGLTDLPDYEVLMERIQVIPSANGNESLYNEFVIPDDENGIEDEIPDFLKDETDLERIN